MWSPETDQIDWVSGPNGVFFFLFFFYFSIFLYMYFILILLYCAYTTWLSAFSTFIWFLLYFTFTLKTFFLLALETRGYLVPDLVGMVWAGLDWAGWLVFPGLGFDLGWDGVWIPLENELIRNVRTYRSDHWPVRTELLVMNYYEHERLSERLWKRLYHHLLL